MANLTEYSDQDVAAAKILMEEKAGSSLQASYALKVPQQSLQQWQDGTVRQAALASYADEVRLVKLQRSKFWDEILDLALNRARELASTANNFRDVVWAAAVAQDKWLLLNGSATSKVEHTHTLADYYRDALKPLPTNGQIREARVVEAGRVGTDAVPGEVVEVGPITSQRVRIPKGPSQAASPKKRGRPRKNPKP